MTEDLRGGRGSEVGLSRVTKGSQSTRMTDQPTSAIDISVDLPKALKVRRDISVDSTFSKNIDEFNLGLLEEDRRVDKLRDFVVDFVAVALVVDRRTDGINWRVNEHCRNTTLDRNGLKDVGALKTSTQGRLRRVDNIAVWRYSTP